MLVARTRREPSMNESGWRERRSIVRPMLACREYLDYTAIMGSHFNYHADYVPRFPRPLPRRLPMAVCLECLHCIFLRMILPRKGLARSLPSAAPFAPEEVFPATCRCRATPRRNCFTIASLSPYARNVQGVWNKDWAHYLPVSSKYVYQASHSPSSLTDPR